MLKTNKRMTAGNKRCYRHKYAAFPSGMGLPPAPCDNTVGLPLLQTPNLGQVYVCTVNSDRRCYRNHTHSASGTVYSTVSGQSSRRSTYKYSMGNIRSSGNVCCGL